MASVTLGADYLNDDVVLRAADAAHAKDDRELRVALGQLVRGQTLDEVRQEAARRCISCDERGLRRLETRNGIVSAECRHLLGWMAWVTQAQDPEAEVTVRRYTRTRCDACEDGRVDAINATSRHPGERCGTCDGTGYVEVEA